MKIEGLILTALSPRLAIVHVKLAVFPASIVTVSGPVDRIVADDTRELSDCNGCFDLLCEKNPATKIIKLFFNQRYPPYIEIKDIRVGLRFDPPLISHYLSDCY